MIQHVFIAVVLYSLFALQLGWVSQLDSLAFAVWLPGLGFLLCANVAGGKARLAWAAILGLFTDCLSLDQLGINVLITTFLAMIVTSLRSGRVHSGSLLVTSFLTTFFWRFIQQISLSILGYHGNQIEHDFLLAFKNAAANCAVVLIVLMPIFAGRFVLGPRSGSSLSLRNRWTMLTDQ